MYKLLWFPKRWDKLKNNPKLIFQTTNRMRVYNFHEILKNNNNVESTIYGFQKHPINIDNYNVFIFQKNIPNYRLVSFLSSQPSKFVILDQCDPLSDNFVKNKAHDLCDIIVTSNVELTSNIKNQGAKVSVRTILDSHEIADSLQKKHLKKKTLNVSWYGVGDNYFSFVKRFKTIFDESFIKFSWACGENEKWINEWGFTKNINMELDWRLAPEQKNSWQNFLLKSDVGIVPVYDQVKAPHKILNYMALGIPVICSPIDSHKRIIKHGKNGFFANNDHDWIKYLHLLRDWELRKNIGKEAIKTAKEHYSVESTANRYFELILDEFSKKKKAKPSFINKIIGSIVIKKFEYRNN